MFTAVTILDPRFKSINLNNALSIFKAIRIIKPKITEIKKNNFDDSNISNSSKKALLMMIVNKLTVCG